MTDDRDIQDKIFTIRGVQAILDKDLGKKWFAFAKMDINSLEIIKKLEIK